MSQDNPEAGDVFVCDNPQCTVYLLVYGKEKTLLGLWFNFLGVPQLRPLDCNYPDSNQKFLCNISGLFKKLEEKLQDAALNDRY